MERTRCSGAREDGHRPWHHLRARRKVQAVGLGRDSAGVARNLGPLRDPGCVQEHSETRTGQDWLEIDLVGQTGQEVRRHRIGGRTLLAGDFGGDRCQDHDVADPRRGDQAAEPVRAVGPSLVDGRAERSGRTGRCGVPEPTGIWGSVLRSGVRQAVPRPPATLVEAAGVAQPQDSERPVRHLGVHPSHRLREVVHREVPPSGEGRHQRRERGQADGEHTDGGRELPPSELGLAQIALERRDPQPHRGGCGRRRRSEQHQRIDRQSTRPPPPGHPGDEPEHQGDRPEARCPSEPDPSGKDKRRCGRHDEAPRQRRPADRADGEPEERAPRCRSRRRRGDPEHSQQAGSGGKHADHPRQADQDRHGCRTQGEPQGPPCRADVAEEQRRYDYSHGHQ